MHLEGWNSIPTGYGASFDLTSAPVWLRVWFSTPFIDRFAYPVAVRRGYATLSPHPGWPTTGRGSVPDGWRVTDDLG
jgi:hypothetical protein